mmetsp:Transcript_638/g.816  ORF Transcript_638/g.816 Transcript_638/m.816 type:complete len:123 (+) Transcript_638:131-499(+)
MAHLQLIIRKKVSIHFEININEAALDLYILQSHLKYDTYLLIHCHHMEIMVGPFETIFYSNESSLIPNFRGISTLLKYYFFLEPSVKINLSHEASVAFYFFIIISSSQMKSMFPLFECNLYG